MKKMWFPKKPRKTTWVWCPICHEDLTENNSFLENTKLVYYRCSNCHTKSSWDFDAPAPILIDYVEEESWLQVLVITDSGTRVYVCKSCGATRGENETMFHYETIGAPCSDIK